MFVDVHGKSTGTGSVSSAGGVRIRGRVATGVSATGAASRAGTAGRGSAKGAMAAESSWKSSRAQHTPT